MDSAQRDRSEKMDAVLPLLMADLERFEVLAESLKKNFHPLSNLWIVVRDIEYEAICKRVEWSACRVVRESALIPEVAVYRRLPKRYSQRIKGWYVQQLIKFAIAKWIETEFYLTLDADVICLRSVEYEDLVTSGRAIVKVSTNDVHAQWYSWAERILGGTRSGVTHGVTPAIFSRTAVLSLQSHLAAKVAPPLQKVAGLFPPGLAQNVLSGWVSYLIRAIPWTEYSLYHTFLEQQTMVDRYHEYCDDNVIYDGRHSLWHNADIDSWSIGDLHPRAFFIVAQSNTGVPISLVKSRLLSATSGKENYAGSPAEE